MEGPGMSLFQGAASLHINSSAQDRMEEQEELEDQKRRNEELKHKLANAFDDLLDDDEASSVNSSGNFTLDAAQTNGAHQGKPGLPPTYVESLNHLKDAQNGSESPRALCDTPRNHHEPPLRSQAQDESMKPPYAQYAGGDTQNHRFHQEYREHVNGLSNYDVTEDYMNNEQLKVMYEMRVKECQLLAGQMEKLESEIESLRMRLAATASDRDKAELSLQEVHHLLASGKHKLIELEQQVTSLTEKLVESNEEKEQLRLELMATNISLQDAQQNLHSLKVAHSHDTDTLFREQQDRHREEVDRLQTDLRKAKNRLDEKENEIRSLEKRCSEKDREKDSVLIEKGTTINRLASELESAQNRLLAAEMAKANDKSSLEATMRELTLCRNNLAAAQKEFDNWRCTLRQILLESLPDNTYIGEHPSSGQLTTLKEVLSHQKHHLQKMTVLQGEINKRDEMLERHRKQEAELWAKVEEYKSTETQLNSRIAELQEGLGRLGGNSDGELVEKYRQQNERLQAELDKAKLELKALFLKCTDLEMEYDKVKESQAPTAQGANADLIGQLESYSAQLKDTLRENGELKNLYIQACSSRDTVSRELKELQALVQKEREQRRIQENEYVLKIKKEKEHVEKLMAELSHNRDELSKANKRISEVQREFTDKQKQFTEKLDKYLEDEKSAMRNEMTSCSQCDRLLKQIPGLEEQITAQESNEQLIKELKDKAEFFQQYIVERYRKLNGLRSVGTSTEDAPAAPPLPLAAERALADEEALAVKNTMCMQEKAIRDQIADKYTLEIKTMEMNCSRRIKEMELQQYQTIITLKELVESKAQQVETLKDKLVSEKAVATQMLDSKEKEISVLIKEHNDLQKACQQHGEHVARLTLKHEYRIKKMIAHEVSLQKELEEWKEKSKTTALEHQAVKKKYSELKSVLREMEQKCHQLQNELQALLEKYSNCKKTVLTYKDYVAKKDEHISSEMRRIQDEYREMFVKLQTQLNHHVNCRVHELRNSGAVIQEQQFAQYDYSERMKKLNEEFAKITEFKRPDAE